MVANNVANQRHRKVTVHIFRSRSVMHLHYSEEAAMSFEASLFANQDDRMSDKT
jgi:hypothetical protein